MGLKLRKQENYLHSNLPIFQAGGFKELLRTAVLHMVLLDLLKIYVKMKTI